MIWATPERRLRLGWELFLISFLALYAELVVIRWLASTVGERTPRGYPVRGEPIGHPAMAG